MIDPKGSPQIETPRTSYRPERHKQTLQVRLHGDNPADSHNPPQKLQQSDDFENEGSSATHREHLDKFDSTSVVSTQFNTQHSSKDDQWPTYLCSYRYQGKTWGFDIKAPSLEDAQARLMSIKHNSNVDGKLFLEIPINENLYTKVKNFLQGLLQ